jgi:uncharacterized membrane protein
VQRLLVRLVGGFDSLRASLWLVPTAFILGALVLARLLVEAEPLPERFPLALVFGGSSDGARAVLGELAGATVTVVGLVFSLTVIALQMASSQFSPRLLRSFLKDRGVQVVLGGMLGSAVFDVAVLRTVRSPSDDLEAFVPRAAVTVALILALGAVGLLVYFLHHITRMLRVDVTMGAIKDETLLQIRNLPADREVLPDVVGPAPPDSAHVVTAGLAGYLQRVDLAALGSGAREARVVVRLRPVMGQWVTEGTTLAWVWGEADASAVDANRADVLVHGGLHLGPDRTESQDLAFGLRQLQDIAARSLSPGVNDPTTAVQAIGQMAAVMAALARQPLGADLALDGDGAVRVVVPRPTFASHLDLAIGQSRCYGADEPDVLIALLQLLIDVGELVADHADRAEAVRRQIGRVVAAADLDDAGDLERVGAIAEVARRTLDRGMRPAASAEAG